MNPPANWYPDPTGRHGQRYWDGQQWTEHVFTDGVQDVDPLELAVAESTTDEAIADEATADAVASDDAVDDDDGATAVAASSGDEDPADEMMPDEGAADEGPADEGPAEDEPDGDGAAHDGGTEADAANGLFEDARGQDAWTPQEEGDVEDDTAVAPDMEAADVVASLDEVGEGTSAADSDAPPVSGDMSDAFVLAPETASRIVKRRSAEVGDAAQPSEPAAPPAGADDDAATGAGAIDAPPPAVDTPPISDAPPTAETAPPAAAPPGSTAAPAGTSGDLGITGDLLGGAFAERSGAGPVALQNSRLLRCSITPADAVVARQGTMVAYQGDVSFDRQGAGGVTRAIKRAATGEGLAMMRAEGSGDVFFADGAQHVFLLQLAGGPGLSVNGRNVLAFSAALEWDIQRVKGASLLAGGLFNTTFTGTGWVALVSDGEPVVLHTDEAQTHVDVNALVAWSAGLSTRIVSSASAKSLVGLGSGEAFQMAFDGPGIVIVQPSEGPLGGAQAT